MRRRVTEHAVRVLRVWCVWLCTGVGLCVSLCARALCTCACVCVHVRACMQCCPNASQCNLVRVSACSVNVCDCVLTSTSTSLTSGEGRPCTRALICSLVHSGLWSGCV